MLGVSERCARDPQIVLADVGVGRLREERMRTGSMNDTVNLAPGRLKDFRTIEFDLAEPKGALKLKRAVERYPYVPSDPARLAEDCYEAYQIQVQGLTKRLEATGMTKLVIGVSGGWIPPRR